MTKLTITTLLLAFSTALVAQQKIEKEFTNIEKINMSTGSGSCVLKKSDSDKVYVTVEFTYNADKYTPEFEQTGSTLRIKEEFNGFNVKGESNWTIMVPDNMDIRFNTGSGDFEAEGLSVELDVNAGSGDFVLTNMKGEISTNAGSGRLKINGFEGDIRANSGSGNLSVAGANGTVNLNCGSGNISLTDVTGAINANAGSGSVDALNVAILDKSDFNAGSGDVNVKLAAEPKGDISVNSGSGDAVLDYNNFDINALVVMRANKNNGKIEAPFEFDTTEEIYDNGRNPTIQKTAKIGNAAIKVKIGTGSGTAKIVK